MINEDKERAEFESWHLSTRGYSAVNSRNHWDSDSVVYLYTGWCGRAARHTARIAELEEGKDRAERALLRAGYTHLEGAQEWLPPIGPSASPLLDKIDALEAEVARLKAAIPSLYPVIKWLENGCNTSDAIAELKIYQSRIDEARKGGA